MSKSKAKSTAKMFPFRDDDSELFKDVVFLVEATHHEQHCFWHDYHYKPKYDNTAIEDWEQVMEGRIITIGEVDKRPVCICINWAYLEGYKVMFYEATSQLVDHKMVDDWIDHFSENIKWDAGTRVAQTNSNNFHNCLHAIEALVKKRGKGKGSGYPKRASYFRAGEKPQQQSEQKPKLNKKIMDLVRLSINNPSEHERIAAATKACKMINELLG